IADADKSYADKSWIPAYETAMKARVAAASARDKSLARIPALKSRLDELKAERDSLKNQNAAAYAPNELASLDTELTKAEATLTGNSIKDAVIALKTSSELIDKIHLLGKSALVQEKINRAESSLAQIKASPYAADVAAKTAEAEAKTSEAKSSLAGGKPDDASTSADEALGIIDGILIELAKKDEEAKNVAAMKKDTEPEPVADTEKQSVVDKVVAEAEDTIHYIVQWRKHKTDCLWRIAEKLYRNARLWPVIYMANRDQIKDPDLIYPGQKLVIPPAPKKKKAWELDKPIPIPQPENVEPEKDNSAVNTDQPAVKNESPADTTETAPSEDNSDNAVEPTGDTEPPAEETVEQPSDTTDATDNGGDSVDGTGDDGKETPADNPDETTPPTDDTAPSGDDSSHNDYTHDSMTVRIAAADLRGQLK
ncbi:MAG TPA: LysM peptidoglycan-binding domain-containing protein, partial [Spirochaetota bacterium]|nr:LysM peptidoglycan-binding domain-containing protein [Spirochaetota bacterium]